MPKEGSGRPMGRPPKPVEQKRALGVSGLPAAPMPGKGLTGGVVPELPESLRGPGSELWVHVWTAGRSWLAVESDRSIVELLCQAQDEAFEIRELLASGEVPRFYTTANGQVVSHPLVGQLKDLRTQQTTWFAAIGFSPADRARLGLAEVRVRDELDELERRRRERAG